MTVIRTICVVCIAVFAFAFQASAQDWGTVMTPDRPLNVRSGRSLNTDRVTTIMPGERVRMDFTKGEWSAVFSLSVTERNESSALGYVKTKYLQPAKSGQAVAWGKLLAPKGMLNIRSKRSRTSEHVQTLQAGQVIRADFLKDDWYAVFKPDETVRDEKRALGYARAKYLFPASKAQTTALKTVQTGGKKKAVDAGNVEKVQNEPMPQKPEPEPAHGSIQASASANQSEPKPSAVTVKVEPTPITVEPRQKTEQPPTAVKSPLWGRVVTLKRRANVRSKRTASSSLMSTLKPGDSVRVDFLDRGWYAVFPLSESKRDLGKALGYVYAPLLGEPTADIQTHTLRPKPEEQPQPVPAQPLPTISAAKSTQPALSNVVSMPDGTESMTIVPVDQTNEPHKGPVPRADKVRHGFTYGIIERNTGSNSALGRLLVKVYLDLTVIPDDTSLRDFAKTVAKEELGQAKELLMLIYLPGQDTKDLAYCQAQFDSDGLVEFWTRRSTLYGTRFLP